MVAPGEGVQLTLRASGNGGYDENDRETSATTLSPAFDLFRRGGTHVGGDVQLQLSVPGRRVNFGAGWASAFRSYQAVDNALVSHHAAAGVTAGLTQHITVSASLFGSYSPPYQLNLFPGIGLPTIGQATVVPVDNSLSLSHLISYGSGTTLSYNMTKRSSLTLGYDFRDVMLGNRVFAGRAQDTNGALHVGMTKSLGLRLGYRNQRYEYVDPTTGLVTPVHADTVDLGLDYGLGHGLKLTRRTTATVGFGLGTYTDRALKLQLRAFGNANVSQQLFRTWSLTVGYYRGLNFIDGFGVPIFSDSISGRLSGQLSRRVGAYANASYSLDRFGNSSEKFRSHRFALGTRVSLTQQLDGFVQYVNYHHAFPDTAFLLQGALPTFNRQGVNGGLTLTLPLLGGRRVVPRVPS